MGETNQQHHNTPRQRPRRLTSISNLARSLTLRRSHGVDSTHWENDNKLEKSLERAGKMHLFTPKTPRSETCMPRSTTFTNIPRPISGLKHAQPRLPTSKTTTALLTSRIPTPLKYTEKNAKSGLPSVSSREQRFGSSNWRHSIRSPHSHDIGVDDFILPKPSQVYKKDGKAMLSASSSARWSLENGPPTRTLTPDTSIGLAVSDFTSSNLPGSPKQRNKAELRIRSNLFASRFLDEGDTSSNSTPASESPCTSHEIVRRRPLHPTEAQTTKLSPAFSSENDRLSDKSNKTKPCYQRLVPSNHVLEADEKSLDKGTPFAKSSFETRHQAGTFSGFKRLAPQVFLPRSLSTPDHVEQPTAYWIGRFVSLQDKYYQEHGKDEFVKMPVGTNEAMWMRSQDVNRIKCIFERLEKECGSKPTLKSLVRFKKEYAKVHCLPEILLKGPPPTKGKDTLIGRTRQITHGAEKLERRQRSEPSVIGQEVLPYMKISRKPLPIECHVISPMDLHSVHYDDPDDAVLKNQSKSSLISHGSGKDQHDVTEGDRSLFGRLIEKRRKTS